MIYFENQTQKTLRICSHQEELVIINPTENEKIALDTEITHIESEGKHYSPVLGIFKFEQKKVLFFEIVPIHMETTEMLLIKSISSGKEIKYWFKLDK